MTAGSLELPKQTANIALKKYDSIVPKIEDITDILNEMRYK